MAKKDDKAGAPEVMNAGQTAVPEGFEQQQTGFPPYWGPEHGKTFRGVVIERDDRDPEFMRFLLKATAPVACAQGPAEDQTEVQVKAGEFFTCSAYAALPLDRYVGCEVFVQAKQKRDIKGGKEVWDFALFCSAETARLVADRQAKMLAEAQAAIPG
jgi:hypothetical protein